MVLDLGFLAQHSGFYEGVRLARKTMMWIPAMTTIWIPTMTMTMTMVGATEATTRRAGGPWFLLLFWLEVEGRKAWAI